MKLILVRHGQTIENIKNIVQGQTHGNFTELGIEQARKVGLRLKEENINTAYSSDLKRASDTTKEIMKFHSNASINFIKKLREFSRGVFDGKSREIFNEHKKTITCPFHLYRWENGERLKDAQDRMVEFYKNIIKEHKGETVLVVSHGATITSLLLYLHKESFDNYHDFHPDNAAVTVIDVGDEFKHKVQILNCTKHFD